MLYSAGNEFVPNVVFLVVIMIAAFEVEEKLAHLMEKKTKGCWRGAEKHLADHPTSALPLRLPLWVRMTVLQSRRDVST